MWHSSSPLTKIYYSQWIKQRATFKKISRDVPGMLAPFGKDDWIYSLQRHLPALLYTG